MSDIDPKRGGKCWSCRYCEDIGTHGYDGSTFYMRKCTNSSKDYVDSCTSSCGSYVWDGETTEYWKQSSYSSSSSSSYSSSSSSSSGGGKGCLIAVIVVVALAIIGYIGLGVMGEIAKEEKAKENTYSADGYYDNAYGSDDAEAKTATVRPSEGLRLRSGAGTSYSKILTMEKGETVTVIELENGWAYVDYYGTKGWCSADYLDMN